MWTRLNRTVRRSGSFAVALGPILSAFVASVSSGAFAQATLEAPAESEPSEADPTGGAYTTPTLLFVPAGALPAWNARVITALEMQGPTPADRLAVGSSLGFRPSVGGEIGLPAGITLGAGTAWVGGDTSPTPTSEGISPYLQARYHIAGARDGRGLQLGASLTYKFVGFEGDPGELETAISAQYREPRYELGLEGVFGKDFATTGADAEIHAYALYRVLPQLGIGGAGQARIGLVTQPDDPPADLIGGAIASLTIARWQVAALGGVTTVGLDNGKVGGLGQVFATARF